MVRKALWTTPEVTAEQAKLQVEVSIANGTGKEGKTISVNAFTNCEEVELLLNGRSLGAKKLAEFQNRTISWEVPFEAGTLRTVARNRGIIVASDEVRTTGNPVKIVDRCEKPTLKADREDLAHIFITLCDESGNTVYSATVSLEVVP